MDSVKITDTTIENSRVVNAPREKVFKAWTNPEHLARWWGPKGFTNTFNQFELKPGGNWHFIMHGPDGAHYKNHVVFEEIIPVEKIVLKHATPPVFQVTATFKEIGNKTKVTFLARFKTSEELNKVKLFTPQANEQNFDRLQAELTRMT